MDSNCLVCPVISTLRGGAFGLAALRRLYTDLLSHGQGAAVSPEASSPVTPPACKVAETFTSVEKLQTFITPHSAAFKQRISRTLSSSVILDDQFFEHLLVFPATLNAHERHTIHTVAEELNASSQHVHSSLRLLYHQSFDIDTGAGLQLETAGSVRQLLVSCAPFSGMTEEDTTAICDNESTGVMGDGGRTTTFVALEGLDDSSDDDQYQDNDDKSDKDDKTLNTPRKQSQKKKQKLKKKNTKKLGTSITTEDGSKGASLSTFSSIGGQKAVGGKASKVTQALGNENIDEWALLEMTISENEVRNVAFDIICCVVCMCWCMNKQYFTCMYSQRILAYAPINLNMFLAIERIQ